MLILPLALVRYVSYMSLPKQLDEAFACTHSKLSRSGPLDMNIINIFVGTMLAILGSNEFQYQPSWVTRCCPTKHS